MGDVMVTGRMTADKKARGSRILANAGLSASQAINLMYDRLLDEGDAGFLDATQSESSPVSAFKWQNAATFIDALPQKRSSRFHSMSDSEIKMDRLHARGLV